MNTNNNQIKGAMMIAVIFLLTACGGNPDKRAELEKLKAQYVELGNTIESIEKELALSDTTTVAKVKDVVVTELQPAYFKHYIDVQGRVDADESVDIRPVMAGKVQKVLVNEGDLVQAGQIIAEIDHDVYTRQLNSLKPQIDLATEVFNRQKRLWDQKIGSEVQFLQAKTQKESLEKQADIIRESIELSMIKTPIGGTVDFVGLKIGELASAATMEPAFRIVNTSGLKVKGDISESYASKVKRGAQVLLHFPDQNKNVESRITFVEKMIDPMTRAFTAEASINGQDGEYHPNMVAILKIVDYENPQAIVVPINAIQSVNDHHSVYVAVVEGSKTIARKRTVVTGSNYDGQVEILEGLAPNDKLIIAGQLELADGMLVRF